MVILKKSRQRGVALLFALGMLSLLMVMGLAFVSTSILAQRVAMNNSHRAEARSLAQAAVNRIAISATAFQILAEEGKIPWDFSNVYSYGDLPGDSPDTAKNDGLFDYTENGVSVEGKLNYPCPYINDGATKKTAHNLKENDVRWIYLRNTSKNASDEIIGRIAFQVLPEEGKITLPAVLSGFLKSSIDYRGRKIPSDDQKIPWFNRWGQDIDEMYFQGDTQNPLNNSSDFWDEELAKKEPDSAKHSIPGNLESFFNKWSTKYPYLGQAVNDGKIVHRDGRRWFTRWFGNGVVFPVGKDDDKDVATDEKIQVDYRYAPSADESWEDIDLGKTYDPKKNIGSDVYHRFNIGRQSAVATSGTDDWYPRLGKPEENSLKAIEALTATGTEKYKINAKDDFLCSSIADRGGIPALRLTANTAGSFDSLENRRKQIAANLNDYCDSDSIPTQPNDIGDGKVAYFGNEKTRYINEIGIGGIIHSSKTSGFEDSPAVTVKLESGVVAELVNIYNDDQGSNYTLRVPTYLKTKVTVTPTFIIRYRKNGLINPSSEIQWDAISKEITWASAENKQEIAISSDKWKKSGTNYWVGTESKTCEESFGVAKTLLERKANDLGGEYVEAKITKFVIQINSLEFGVGRMALEAEVQNSAGGKDVAKVDYVNAPDGNNGYMKDFSDAGISWPVKTIDNDDTYHLPFLIGRMEAKDPRQNLNINVDYASKTKCESSSDFQRSDWFFEPQLKFTCDSNGYDQNVSLEADSRSHFMSINGELLANKGGGAAGRPNAESFEKAISISTELANSKSVNLFGDPHNPVVSGGSVENDCDQEETTDPAWQENERKKHISTAFIRNAPMRSPWELGAIHRGAVWETLNIAKASTGQKHTTDGWNDPNGRSYAAGDGILLDEIKMVPYVRSMGKVNLNLINQTNDRVQPTESADKESNTDVLVGWVGKALLNNLRFGQELYDFTSSSKILENQDSTHFSAGDSDARNLLNGISGGLNSRAEWLTSENSNDMALQKICASKIGVSFDEMTDAEREEAIGKMINLVDTKPSLPCEFKAVVVAQTIKDIGGTEKSENVTKVFGEDGEDDEDCKIGTFDVKTGNKVKYHYFDEITGEVKMMVTFRRDPETGRITVLNTEYIE